MTTSPSDEKRCSKCGVVKPLSDFYRARKRASGYESSCKVCNKKRRTPELREYQREYMRTRREQEGETKDRSGFVYVLLNRAWPGWCKIGETTDLDRRLSAYQIGSPFRDYVYAGHSWVTDRKRVEIDLIAQFEQFNTRGEWIKVDSHYALEALEILKTHSLKEAKKLIYEFSTLNPILKELSMTPPDEPHE